MTSDSTPTSAPARHFKPLVLVLGLGVLAAGLVAWLRTAPAGGDPALLVREIRVAILSHRWEEAEATLERLAASRPRTTEDELLRAEIEFGRGRIEDGLRRLGAVPDGDPLAMRARLLAGQGELRRSRLRHAERFLIAALDLDAKATGVDLDNPRPASASTPARRGLVYIYGMQARRRELDEQFRALAAHGDLGFQDMLVWTLALEDIWINTGVREDLERFLAADPEDRQSRLALAEVLLRGGELDACEAVLEPLSGSDPDALALRARLAWNRSDLDAVRVLVAAGPAEHPGLARLRGQLALRLDDPNKAAEAFNTAVRLDPANQEAMQGLALALRRLGRTEEAEDLARTAERHRALTALLELCRTEASRSDPTLAPRLAAACEAIGRLDLARGWYRAALTPDPTNPTLQRQLRRLRDLERADSQNRVNR